MVAQIQKGPRVRFLPMDCYATSLLSNFLPWSFAALTFLSRDVEA